MSTVEIQCIGVTYLGPDDTEVAGSVEKTGIPALPIRE
jgi:hypothetical protein